MKFKAPPALLLDIDGVLYVGDVPIEGAIEALEAVRPLCAGVRLVTNTTSRSRAQIVDHLRELGFNVGDEEVLTPAALAVGYCREHGFKNVRKLVGAALLEDLAELGDERDGEPVDAVLLGDIGNDFNAELLNETFRTLLGGAKLIALQHNRYWRHPEGMRLDVGAYSAALEYATNETAAVIGKPSPAFFESALSDLGAGHENALMVDDDIEADVSGALAAGLQAALVRTGKYRPGTYSETGFGPSAVIDSVADLPALLA
jgi:HAD superfamily hydrolase (TIGR01458 family)